MAASKEEIHIGSWEENTATCLLTLAIHCPMETMSCIQLAKRGTRTSVFATHHCQEGESRPVPVLSFLHRHVGEPNGSSCHLTMPVGGFQG
jgi:hypothetical protein